MGYKFVEGMAYEAVPVLLGAKHRLCICTGRDGGRITFAWINDISVESVEACDGREFVRPTLPDGMYTVSSVAPLDIKVVAPILDLMRRREAV